MPPGYGVPVPGVTEGVHAVDVEGDEDRVVAHNAANLLRDLSAGHLTATKAVDDVVTGHSRVQGTPSGPQEARAASFAHRSPAPRLAENLDGDSHHQRRACQKSDKAQ